MDDYHDDAPIVILASLWLLMLNMVPIDEWRTLNNQERCERMEAAGYQWTGTLWTKVVTHET